MEKNRSRSKAVWYASKRKSEASAVFPPTWIGKRCFAGWMESGMSRSRSSSCTERHPPWRDSEVGWRQRVGLLRFRSISKQWNSRSRHEDTDSRPPRFHAVLQGLGAGSRLANVDEQSRSRGRRTTGRSRRLWRPRESGAKLGVLQADRRVAPQAHGR